MVIARAWWVLAVPVLAAVAVAILAVSSGGGETLPIEGCTQVEVTELYVQDAYACTDGARVLTFSDVTARDAYLQLATHFGVKVIDKGERWARIRGV